MGLDQKKHLKICKDLVTTISDALEPKIGCFEDVIHPKGASGDATYEVDVPVEDAVEEFFKTLDVGVAVYTEDRPLYRNSDEVEAIYLIDPLDGSRNARRAVPVWACSIAIFEPEAKNISDISMGVVARLDMPALYTAGSAGAFKDGKPIASSKKETLNDAVISVGSYFADSYKVHSNLMSELAAMTGGGVNDVMMKLLGSTAFELCLLAEGGIDMMVDLRAAHNGQSTPKTYDVAAGFLIAEKAGALISYGGEKIPQTVALEPKNPLQFIAAGNKALFTLLSNIY